MLSFDFPTGNASDSPHQKELNGIVGNANNGLKVISDRTVKGFTPPEAVAFGPLERILYINQLGPLLKPTLKDVWSYCE